MTATPPRGLKLPPPPSTSELLDTSALSSTDSPSSTSASSPTHFLSSHTPSSGHYGQTSVPLPKANTLPAHQRRSIRPSYSTVGTRRRVSRATVGGGFEYDDEGPKLPTLVPGIRPAYSTPLPTLPMMVLCIAMLSELLSANVCTPFLLKMVEGFFLSSGKEKNSETEAQVGLWTGNLVSVFFITQFFTSLLWSSIADRHGRRAVIVASLLGSAMAVVTFGTSESLPEAICVRLVQGIFGGAVGVVSNPLNALRQFRGSIRDITDDTNATRAYAILGFSWGFGGVVGPILGGVFESPAQNFPNTFLANVPLFQSFPYILPTMIAGVILVIGSIMACFLSWDGGVRGGTRIALPVEKNEPLVSPARNGRAVTGSPESARTAIPVPSVRAKRSAVLSPREEGNPPTFGASFAARRDSRASLGTAYGYGGIRSKHPTLAARAALEAARRVSQATVRPTDDDEENEETPRLGIAQKFLLANEENTFNINDLWVSAAVAQDTAVFEDEDTENESAQSEDEDGTPQASPDTSMAPGSIADRRMSRNRMTSGSMYRSMASHRMSMHTGRRFSTSSGTLPAIFGNTGLNAPALALADESPASSPEDPFFASPAGRAPIGGLSVISERPGSNAPIVSPEVQMVGEKKESAWKSLPLQMISQYGLLALHGTIHDQLFLSFLVSPYRSGGLGLNPANFSFLIALMCLFQLLYQFWLYPRLGPPLGRFTHIQMFRLGCCLYVPAYLCLPLLHSVASPDKQGGFVIMSRESTLTALTIVLTMITAVRYCGGTLAYTSCMVLVNAMSPPHVVGLSNGLAQSTVSMARFFGPILGGTLWSASISGDPSGFYKGFIVVALGCVVQNSLSLFIR